MLGNMIKTAICIIRNHTTDKCWVTREKLPSPTNISECNKRLHSTKNKIKMRVNKRRGGVERGVSYKDLEDISCVRANKVLLFVVNRTIPSLMQGMS